uniref:Uncharacterized protein n=1 Tax=Oncorhynchus mykiss TaxID=8022 RepID=A0A8L0DTR2_ONCMY
MLSAGDVIVFVALLWQHTSPLGFTLTFWCQFTVMFLLSLNSGGSCPSHSHVGITHLQRR